MENSYESVSQFISTIFKPDDHISLRYIETWTEANQKKSEVKRIKYGPAELLGLPENLQRASAFAEKDNANQFFGVCPRFKPEKGFDLASQIRTVRCLWADLDNCNPDEAKERCVKAGLLPPTIIVSSGNGVHLYWLLAEPYLIDDVPDPVPIFRKWDGTKANFYTVGDVAITKPTLSAKALHVQQVQNGISQLIGGDHTQDLARLLRLPGTMNRKDARNGKPPVPCVLHEIEPDRRYAFSEFEQFRKGKKTVCFSDLSEFQRMRFDGLVAECAEADVGERSGKDFKLLCYAKECGLEPDAVWEKVQDIGKFAERSRDSYFDPTWKNAKQSVKQHKHRHGKPEIVVGRQLREMEDEAIGAIVAANQPPRFFIREGAITQLRLDRHKGPIFSPILKRGAMMSLLSRVADWMRWNKDKAGPAKPDKDVAEALLCAGDWPLPPIKTLVECPVLLPDGQWLSQPGYHEDSELWLHFSEALPTVPEQPSQQDIEDAKKFLLDQWLVDFPFVNQASRANALAMMLLPLVRPIITGATPLHLLDAPDKRTGKTLLAKLFATVATGREATIINAPGDKREWRSQIASCLVDGPVYVLFDDVASDLDVPSLATVLTSRVYKARRFGRNDDDLLLPVECVWLATGQNVTASKEIAGRICWVRLDAGVEFPGHRTNFTIASIERWTRQNRGEILAALMTLIQAWIAAGRPDRNKGQPSLGGFEQWASVIGGILDTVGVPGFLANRDEVYEQVAEAEGGWRQFVRLWWATYKNDGVKPGELMKLAAESDLLAEVTDNAWKFGVGLKKEVGKIYEGKRIERTEDVHGKGYFYKLVSLQPVAEPPKDTIKELASRNGQVKYVETPLLAGIQGVVADSFAHAGQYRLRFDLSEDRFMSLTPEQQSRLRLASPGVYIMDVCQTEFEPADSCG